MVLARYLSTHSQALDDRIPLEGILIKRLSKLSFLRGKGLDDSIDFGGGRIA